MSTIPGGAGGGEVGTPCNEVYQREGKSIISDCKKPQKANRCILAVGKSRKRSGFVIFSYFIKDSTFTTVK